MINKKFADLLVNSKFMHNNIEYQKLQPIKISCCKSVNACVASQPANKVFINPNQEVKVNG